MDQNDDDTDYIMHGVGDDFGCFQPGIALQAMKLNNLEYRAHKLVWLLA